MPQRDADDPTDAEDGEIASPCTGVCSVGAGAICPGCFRSLAEIAGWLGYSRDEKRAVLASVAARRAAS